MGARMRAHDWAASPLGPPGNWPQSLRTLVGLILQAKQAMFVAWGPDLAFLYNDAYAPIFGAKHLQALGRPFAEVWSDIWPQISPIVDRTLAGEGSWHEDLLIPMRRCGYQEDAWFSFSYTPVCDDSGKVAGMFCAATETTSKVLADRRKVVERERLQQMFEQAPGIMVMLYGPDHVFELANAAYYQLVGHRDILGKSVREALPELEGQGFFELLDGVYQSGEPFVGQGVPVILQREPGGALEQRFVDFIYQPIRDVDGQITGIFVEGFDITEAKHAEEALRASEEFNRRILESSSDCIKVLDLDARLQFMSHGGMQVMEVDNFGAIQGCDWRTFWSGPEHEKAKQAVETALAGGTGRFQGPTPTAKGTPRWWDVAVTPVLGADGQVEKLLSVSRDITATKQAEEALRESEERLRTLADNLPNGMVYQAVRNADGTVRFTYVSQAVERLHGLSAEAVMADAAGLDAQVLPEHQSLLKNVRQDADANQSYVSVELPMRVASGEVRWFLRSSAPRRLPDGQVVWDGVELDITERKQAEEALRKSEALHRAIIHATPECVKLVAADGRLLDMNPAGLAMIEVPDAASACGAHVLDVIAPEYRKEWRANHARVCKGESLSWEFDIIGLQGTRRRMETHAVPLAIPDGSVAQLAVTRDVTARKQWEDHQRLLINELNHRVKNTLATVQSIASQSLRGADTMEQARAATEARLLALSRTHDVLTRENWEGAGLREIVTRAMEPYDGPNERRVSLSGADIRLPPQMALAIAMALQELATNAVKYGALSKATGKVEIDWEISFHEEAPHLRLQWKESGGPPVKVPRRRGFGTRLIERSLAQDLNSEVRIEFASSGLVCTMDAPVRIS